MGVDSGGVERGKCTKCDCEEYEAKDGQNECGYCGCFPAQHERSISETSERQDIAEPGMGDSHMKLTGMLVV